MFEGPNRIGAPEDQLPEPFDYLAEAEKAREVREAKTRSEKLAAEEARKVQREERLAKQIARSAAKREENARILNDSKKDVQEKLDTVKEGISDSKKEAAEIQGIINDQQGSKAVEMVFGNGSEYIDNDLRNGSEAVFDLNQSVKTAEKAVDTAAEVLARAEAISRAREAIHDVETRIEDEVAGVVEVHHRPAEQTIYDLGEDSEELRNRFQESWVAPEESPVIAAETTSTGSDSSFEYQLPTKPSSPTEQAVQATLTHNEKATDTLRAVSNIRNGAAFVGGLFAGKALSRRSALSRSTESLARETADLKKNVEQIQQTAIAPEAATPYVTPTSSAELLIERQPVLSSGLEQPAYHIPERLTAKSAEPQIPRFELNANAAIPLWIRQLEAELKHGKVPEIKKWQRDVLRVQHPDILRHYEKLDKSSVEAIKEHSYEAVAHDEKKEIKPLSDFDTEFSGPTWKSSSMPAFMREPIPVAPISYSYAEPIIQENGSILADNFLTIIMIGGAIFGAVLIIAFGF